jgi:hypothetical protein
MRPIRLRYRIWHIVVLTIIVSCVVAIVRPVQISMTCEIENVVPHPYAANSVCARVRLTNCSSSAVYCRIDDYHTYQEVNGTWQSRGFSFRDNSPSDNVHFVTVQRISRNSNITLDVPLLPHCRAMIVSTKMSTWKFFGWSWYSSGTMVVDSSTSTSLIRVNPEKPTSEGETAGRTVRGEAGTSPEGPP